MKKLLAIFIAIFLFVPSFVYSKGVDTMATPNIISANMDLAKRMKDAAVSNMNTKANNYSLTNNGITGLWGNVIKSNADVFGRVINSAIQSKNAINTSSLSGLYDAQLAARREALQKQRDSALSGLDDRQKELKQNYYDKRNRVGAQSDIGALNFANFMASRGISGNAGAMPEIYRNNALQGNIGALNQQEAGDNAAIESDRTGIESAYANDLAAAEAEVEAQKLADEINQQNAAQTAAIEQQKLAADQTAKANTLAYNQLQDSKAEYGKNIGQYYNDYQAEINNVLNDNDKTNDWKAGFLSAARQNKIKDLQEAAAKQAESAAKEKQQTFDNDYKTKQLALATRRADYTTNRPYSGGSNGLTANQRLNQTNDTKISNMVNWIYSGKTTNDNIQNLIEKKPLIIQQLIEAGYDGSSALNFYNNIYNDLMR